MATSPTRTRRLAARLAAGLLLVPLFACSDEPVSDATSALDTATETPADGEMTETTMAEDTETDTETAMPSESADAVSTETGVECSGSSCVVTLSGDGTEVDVLGTTVTLGTLEDGQATVGIAGQEVSCSEGESVSAGPLTLECTTITDETVVMTASLG